ncbi:hypothetical protein [Chryseolinea sp. H1M3-3]|uniref:hypothetical protein n=1 Tax=Chryseolinea sp. H1M3-3 TaxID=3034144 RepID=UPI0023ECF2C0|nr:hypothetical protein [Chryseolinea sp. H1M3-3]
MIADHDYIVLYRTLVEKKFLLGSGEGKLKQRELEYLGNLIEEKSKVRLSISTLKRIWRQEVQQLPHPSTLDALVSILDYKDWQDFKKQNLTNEKTSRNESKKKPDFPALPVLIFIGVAILAGSFFILQGFNKKAKGVIISKAVQFSADKTIMFGVPNTVIFHYDLSGVKADSFFLQQSWNPKDKVPIDPGKNYYSAIYYTPGFHFARIMANDSILKFEKVHIQTKGWFPIVKYDFRDKRTLYLDTASIRQDGSLQITNASLQKANVDLSKDFYLRYYNIRDFDGVTSDNFDLETKLKCDKLSSISNTVACPLMEIMFITEENVFFMPLTSKGCVGELDLLMGEIYKSGQDNDLSAFGTEVYQWQTLRIKSENKKVSIFLNGNVIYELQYQKDFGKIKGLIYTFTGPGSVDFLRMKNTAGELIYEDEFNHGLPGKNTPYFKKTGCALAHPVN